MVKKNYDNDFKVMIVQLLKSGQKTKEVSEAYNLDSGTVNRWRREYEAKSGDFSKKRELSPEELELRQLRKELKDVQIERDILKKAVSIFSKSDK
ncbi:transposase [Aquimarina sp. RZ0]|nr:transposase [Aquimarina sp. RZ0]